MKGIWPVVLTTVCLVLAMLVTISALTAPPINLHSDYQPDDSPGDCRPSPERAGNDDFPNDAWVKGNISLATNRTGDVLFQYKVMGYQRDAWEVVMPDGADLAASEGFNRTAEGLEWNQESRYPWYTINLTSFMKGANYTTGDNWAITPVPSHDIENGLQLKTSDSGEVGSSIALVGNHTTHAVQVGCQNIRLLIPTGTKMADNPRRILSSLRYSARSLDIGGAYNRVTIFVSPKSLGRRGGFVPSSPDGMGPGNEAVVDSSKSVTSLRNTWVHEYIHTRQAHSHQYQYSWMREAIPTYLTALLTAQENGYTRAVLETRLERWKTNNRTPLRGLESEKIAYNRGARVLYSVDGALQRENRTVEWIVWRMNQEEDFTISDLEENHKYAADVLLHGSEKQGSVTVKYQTIPEWIPSSLVILLGITRSSTAWWKLVLVMLAVPPYIWSNRIKRVVRGYLLDLLEEDGSS